MLDEEFKGLDILNYTENKYDTKYIDGQEKSEWRESTGPYMHTDDMHSATIFCIIFRLMKDGGLVSLKDAEVSSQLIMQKLYSF